MYQLAAFRAIQGLGAGGLFSLALAIIGDIVPPRERAKYQGYFLAVFGTSSVLGPVIGGFLAGTSSIFGITGWRWVFLVNVPIGLAALVVVSRTLHLRHHRLDHRIDWTGAALLSASLVPLLIVLEQGRDWGWGSGRSILAYGITAVAGLAFFWQEWRMKEEAILPLAMFRIKTVGVASIASVLIGIAMFGGLASLPLYLQIVRGATPTEAGLLLLPMTLGIMTGSISSGQIISRTGRYRIYPVVGSAMLALALFVFHWVRFDTPLWQTMLVMVVFGIGLGFNFQPLTLAVQNAVPPQQIGVATSTATFTRQMGGTIGTAVFLSILFSSVPGQDRRVDEAIAPTKDFQAGMAAGLQAPAGSVDHQVAAGIQAAAQGGAGTAASSSGVLSDSSFLTNLDPRLAKPFLVGFSDAMDIVFLVGAGVMVLRLPRDALPAPGRAAQGFGLRRAQPGGDGRGERRCGQGGGRRPLSRSDHRVGPTGPPRPGGRGCPEHPSRPSSSVGRGPQAGGTRSGTPWPRVPGLASSACWSRRNRTAVSTRATRPAATGTAYARCAPNASMAQPPAAPPIEMPMRIPVTTMASPSVTRARGTSFWLSDMLVMSIGAVADPATNMTSARPHSGVTTSAGISSRNIPAAATSSRRVWVTANVRLPKTIPDSVEPSAKSPRITLEKPFDPPSSATATAMTSLEPKMTPVIVRTAATTNRPGRAIAIPAGRSWWATTGGSVIMADRKITIPVVKVTSATSNPASGNHRVDRTIASTGPRTNDASSLTCSNDIAVCSRSGSSR